LAWARLDGSCAAENDKVFLQRARIVPPPAGQQGQQERFFLSLAFAREIGDG
jgi:hypothetical protein